MSKDRRNFDFGSEMPYENYCDQPYIVKTDDGAWLCTITTGAANQEGQHGQHVTTMRSTDLGRTWSPPVDIEPADGPEASFSQLVKTSFGRIYCFYTYNRDNVRKVIADEKYYPGGMCSRVDVLGYYVFKYSDDQGRSWSEQRGTVPVRETEIDRNNPYGGKIRLFWNATKMFVSEGAVFIPLYKIGRIGYGQMAEDEGWFLKSENLLTERDPDKLVWETLPDGETGLRAPAGGGSVADEHSAVVMHDGSIYCTWRCRAGYPVHAYSRDGGHTWTNPEYATYTPGGRRIKHPRANCQVWRCSNSKYLRWFHNNSTTYYNKGLISGTRNLVWFSSGIEKDGFIHWSQPEIGLYVDNQLDGCSYPDLIEEDGRFFITTTRKNCARVVEVDASLLENLWNQNQLNSVVREGLVVDLHQDGCTAGSSVAAPELPNLDGEMRERGFPAEDRGGFTLDLRIRLTDMDGEQIILDARDPSGKGYVLTTTSQQTVRFEMCDGRMAACWDCDSGVLSVGKEHHLTVIVDGGPKVISYVVDGVLCDGGERREFGYGRFSPAFRNINGAETLQIAPSLHGELRQLRIYDRYLRVSEALGNYRAGLR